MVEKTNRREDHNHPVFPKDAMIIKWRIDAKSTYKVMQQSDFR